VTGDAKNSSLRFNNMENFDRLESFGIYKLARQLFNEFWNDSEVLAKDFRGRELAKQQVRSLDSVCANIEEGYGRGFGRELPQHLKIARGEARESLGRYERCRHLLPADVIEPRTAALNHIIGGLTKTINTIENRKNPSCGQAFSRHPSPVTCHAP
jgi:four helix bundle protein